MTDPESNYTALTKREYIAVAIYDRMIQELSLANEPTRMAATNAVMAADMLIEELNGGKTVDK